MCLDSKLVECGPNRPFECGVTLPTAVCGKFEGDFAGCKPRKTVLITIGLFTIVQLERCVQMMIPAYDYAVPDKQSTSSSADDPCEVFNRIKFPISQFFPPKLSELD